MKKFFAISISIVLTATILSACSQKATLVTPIINNVKSMSANTKTSSSDIANKAKAGLVELKAANTYDVAVSVGAKVLKSLNDSIVGKMAVSSTELLNGMSYESTYKVMEMILNYLSNGQEDSISSAITLTENVMNMSITSSDKAKFGIKALKAIAQLSNNQDAKNIVQAVLNNSQASSPEGINIIKTALDNLKNIFKTTVKPNSDIVDKAKAGLVELKAASTYDVAVFVGAKVLKSLNDSIVGKMAVSSTELLNGMSYESTYKVMEMILNYLSNGQEDSISSTITLTENVMLMSITSSDKDRFGMKALKAIAQLSNNQDAKNIVQKVLNNQQASSNDIKNALTELKKVL